MFNLFARAGKRISPRDAKVMIDNRSVLLIDVRTSEEYRQAHIPGSKNIPLNVLDSYAPRLIPDKRSPLVVYCLSGGRSAQGVAILTQLGYETVYDLGGINAWPYEVVRG